MRKRFALYLERLAGIKGKSCHSRKEGAPFSIMTIPDHTHRWPLGGSSQSFVCIFCTALRILQTLHPRIIRSSRARTVSMEKNFLQFGEHFYREAYKILYIGNYEIAQTTSQCCGNKNVFNYKSNYHLIKYYEIKVFLIIKLIIT